MGGEKRLAHHTGIAITPVRQVQTAFLLCPEASATATMALSTFWASAPPSGLLQRTVPVARGAGGWATVIQMWAAATSISNAVLVSGLSGIDPVRYFHLSHRVDYLTI